MYAYITGALFLAFSLMVSHFRKNPPLFYQLKFRHKVFPGNVFPGKWLSGKRLSGKRLSGKVLFREKSVKPCQCKQSTALSWAVEIFSLIQHISSFRSLHTSTALTMFPIQRSASQLLSTWALVYFLHNSLLAIPPAKKPCSKSSSA